MKHLQEAKLEEEIRVAQEQIKRLAALRDAIPGMKQDIDGLKARAREMMVRSDFYLQFAGHAERGHFVIPVLLPGFDISLDLYYKRSEKWWPAEMPELKGRQFVDMRLLLKPEGGGVDEEQLKVSCRQFPANCLCDSSNVMRRLPRGQSHGSRTGTSTSGGVRGRS